MNTTKILLTMSDVVSGDVVEVEPRSCTCHQQRCDAPKLPHFTWTAHLSTAVIPVSLLLLLIVSRPVFAFDDYTMCVAPRESKSLRHDLQFPCDLSSNLICEQPGDSYPWHQLRRFVRENHGLMRRMYGDIRHSSVLGAEFGSTHLGSTRKVKVKRKVRKLRGRSLDLSSQESAPPEVNSLPSTPDKVDPDVKLVPDAQEFQLFPTEELPEVGTLPPRARPSTLETKLPDAISKRKRKKEVRGIETTTECETTPLDQEIMALRFADYFDDATIEFATHEPSKYSGSLEESLKDWNWPPSTDPPPQVSSSSSSSSSSTSTSSPTTLTQVETSANPVEIPSSTVSLQPEDVTTSKATTSTTEADTSEPSTAEGVDASEDAVVEDDQEDDEPREEALKEGTTERDQLPGFTSTGNLEEHPDISEIMDAIIHDIQLKEREEHTERPAESEESVTAQTVVQDHVPGTLAGEDSSSMQDHVAEPLVQKEDLDDTDYEESEDFGTSIEEEEDLEESAGLSSRDDLDNPVHDGDPDDYVEVDEEVEVEVAAADVGFNACPVKEEVVAPYWANNTRGEVLALLNLYPFEQYIHWEKCTYENEQMFCHASCRCEQQYRLHRLLAFDPSNECRGIFSDWFQFPSCCVCKCYGPQEAFRDVVLPPGADRSGRHGGRSFPRGHPRIPPLHESAQLFHGDPASDYLHDEFSVLRSAYDEDNWNRLDGDGRYRRRGKSRDLNDDLDEIGENVQYVESGKSWAASLSKAPLPLVRKPRDVNN
ncbi:unnamed protein product [Cyprideis torosa]|uniref:Uncharacterized protein n=1 Tax=Cyprideis torosa TaxID=163714 RepID=A0A7R8WFY1_9CRUS|nr:unnamed protein product [Cyprideis torosa]CAG0892006.1 unnamed protein product [Cyprideis torosa]